MIVLYGGRVHLRHRWETIEAIGRVVTQRCEVCGKTRVRVRRQDPQARPAPRLGLTDLPGPDRPATAPEPEGD
ncbi:hypothetical protein ABGB17_24650 [Sphaerisporangium sp. B11E5]|uniref:hypothetical protein n=1 Tax=Sphaerisporangium sp. B11E5 TaxID=3153563 RepID=UPI00325F9180